MEGRNCHETIRNFPQNLILEMKNPGDITYWFDGNTSTEILSTTVLNNMWHSHIEKYIYIYWGKSVSQHMKTNQEASEFT